MRTTTRRSPTTMRNPTTRSSRTTTAWSTWATTTKRSSRLTPAELHWVRDDAEDMLRKLQSWPAGAQPRTVPSRRGGPRGAHLDLRALSAMLDQRFTAIDQRLAALDARLAQQRAAPLE